MSRLRIIGGILKVIEKHEIFLISSHTNPDGDAIGSQLAFHSLLSDLGKKVFLVNTDPPPLIYDFLPNVEILFREADLSDSGPYPGGQYHWSDVEVAVILDCGNLNRIGEKLAECVHPKCALINIDHHESNDYFGTHNLVDVSACATAELVFDLINQCGLEIGHDRAVCLYTAITYDTNSFKYMNATANAHRIVARLIEEGAQPERIAELLYDVIPYQKAKLFGMALETLQLSEDGKIAWMLVTEEMHERTRTKGEDTEGFIDYVRSLKDIEVAILFRETKDGNVKVSLRSKGALNVDQIARDFGGGGHQPAAGCVISQPLDKAVNMILEAVRQRQK